MIAFLAMEKKRRQHHVWRHYLEAWTDGKQLCCLFLRDGNVRRLGTKNVAVQRDFYRLRELTPFHIEFVEALIEKSGPSAEALTWNIEVFTKLFEIRRTLEESAPLSAEAQKVFDIAVNNLEEDMHSAMETAAMPLLRLLKQRDRCVVDEDNQYTMLTWFLGLQFTRTTKIAKAFETFPDADLVPALGILRHIIALNMGYSLFVDRRSSRVTLFRASGRPGLVTSDFPVINAQSLMYEPNPDKLVLYYPVSPTCAMQIDLGHPEPGVVCEELAKHDVLRYNQLVATMAEDQVFADDEDELVRLRAAVGRPDTTRGPNTVE